MRRDFALTGRHGPVPIRLITVANRYRRDVRIIQKASPGLHCPVAAAYCSDVDAVVRAQNAHSAQGRSGACRNSGSGEISSAYLFHWSSFLIEFESGQLNEMATPP